MRISRAAGLAVSAVLLAALGAAVLIAAVPVAAVLVANRSTAVLTDAPLVVSEDCSEGLAANSRPATNAVARPGTEVTPS